MSKGPNKPAIVAGKAQEFLQFLDACRGRPVLHGLKFLLIYLQFARDHNMTEILDLRLAKSIFFHFGIRFLISKPLQY